jgi:hypothetical protein
MGESSKFSVIEQAVGYTKNYHANVRVLYEATSFLGGENQLDMMRIYSGENLGCNL